MMKKTVAVIIFCLSAALAAEAQDKGVDQQNDRIRDAGSERAPASNGTKQNVGTGRGLDFGKGRTPPTVQIPNPYRFTARRDAAVAAIQELMRDRGLTVDTASSKTSTGLVISQPYTFIKGAGVTLSELSRISDVLADDTHGWTRGRYTLVIEAQALDATTTSVSVNARIEGRSESVTGAEWLSIRSNGTTEQDFLASLIEKITGAPPAKSEK